MPIRSTNEALGAFRQVVTVDAHSLHADVSEALGGAGSAPSPHDLFDASLATCKALTACVYAKQRGLALDRVTVEVTRDTTNERKGTYVLDVAIRLEGALDEEAKAKLLDGLTRCPVHRLMTTTDVEIRQREL